MQECLLSPPCSRADPQPESFPPPQPLFDYFVSTSMNPLTMEERGQNQEMIGERQQPADKNSAFFEDRELHSGGVDIARIEKVYRYSYFRAKRR